MPRLAANNPSAGSAEPYWFEWQTGLIQLIELLDEDSDIREVAFQLSGTKGWDDVGVRLKNGVTRLLQMKHSRDEGRLTFGDLIATSPNADGTRSPSLLRSLAIAWRSERTERGEIECHLVTNQASGTNWRLGRPPLAEFLSKLKNQVLTIDSLSLVKWEGEDERYETAWILFKAELNDLSEPQALEFIKALTVAVNAPDLDALDISLKQRLAELTGLSAVEVAPIFNALIARLSKWTSHTRRDGEWIGREEVVAYLSGEEKSPASLGHCEVETPQPFLPSRNRVVDALRTSLLGGGDHKIDFLIAEPGGGKTSCISKLSRDGVVLWKDQAVSIRFYAYLPLNPAQKAFGGDTDIGITPAALWSSLLWQIRDCLRKTSLLSELKVPIWLHGMPWMVARDHVLRLAHEIGLRWGRPFIICVDGIDHAARARRKNLAEFLNTLPPPESIPVGVKFLLAGQPPDAYPEYPVFLRQSHGLVIRHAIGELVDDDIRVLWQSRRNASPALPEGGVVRLLAERGQRRTLPTVFAVEDVRECSTLDEARSVLDSRRLADSLHGYYDAIWASATSTTGEGPLLCAMFALLRERPSGDLMTSSFPGYSKTAIEWAQVLRRLRPLVRETEEGFELVHNDVRVHLESKLQEEPVVLREVALNLATYYRKPTSNRAAAHLSLLDLLTAADKQSDFADDFNPDWVIEAEGLALTSELSKECSVAFSGAVARRDWQLIHSVACASLTLYRLGEFLSNNSSEPPELLERRIIPPFFPAEGEPKPLELWTRSDLSQLISACSQLIACGESNRAAAILRQWLGIISLEEVVRHLAGELDPKRQRRDEVESLEKMLERFGRMCALCRVSPRRNTASGEHSQFDVAFEVGWVRGLAEVPERRQALRLWHVSKPFYLESWITGVREAAKRLRWSEARALLNRLERSHAKLEPSVARELGWFAARAKPRNTTLWEAPLRVRDFGLNRGENALRPLRLMAKWITYNDPVREPAQVAEELARFLNANHYEEGHRPFSTLLLRVSAVVGRLLRYADRHDYNGAVLAVPPASLGTYLDAIWCKQPDMRSLPHDEFGTSRKVGAELAVTALECGGAYQQLLCDRAELLFEVAMLSEEGPKLFEILVQGGKQDFVTQKIRTQAEEIIRNLHEQDSSSRGEIVGNMIQFTQRLGLSDLTDRLMARWRISKLGYLTHKEWIFEPLIRWFDSARKNSASVWRIEGLQMLALDLICERQNGDNGYSEQLTSQIGAAAMNCGPNHCEALLNHLVNRGAKSPLWDLMKVADDGLQINLKEGRIAGDETLKSLVSVAIALGRWPIESPLVTIENLRKVALPSGEPGFAQSWREIRFLAANIQGLPVEEDVAQTPSTVHQPSEGSPESILDEILRPKQASERLLGRLADLSEAIAAIDPPIRSQMVSQALGALETSSAFSRHIEHHDKDLADRLYRHLTEEERWRLMGAVTALSGDLGSDLFDSNWPFAIAFSAVDLLCLARANQTDRDFGKVSFNQLLNTHWRWQGLTAPDTEISIPATSTWQDFAQRILQLLLSTDSCDTLYMAMCGVRFFAEAFPHQIPSLVEKGVSSEPSYAPIISLCHLWATKHPQEIAPALVNLSTLETRGDLDRRLDAWMVVGLQRLISNEPLREFTLPPRAADDETALGQESPPFEGEVHMNGLMRHNSFSRMTQLRIDRARIALGSMEVATGRMARIINSPSFTLPSMELKAAKRLALDSQYPRPGTSGDHVVSDSIMFQCAGQTWSPRVAASVRLLLGFGMDPWIASAPPNLWRDRSDWPSDYDVEGWYAGGAPRSSPIWNQLNALLTGEGLDSSEMVIGAILHCPTYRRDIQLRYWLELPASGVVNQTKYFATPAGRATAGWLPGWSFADPRRPGKYSVRFEGSTINYPNCDLEITPTIEWIERWNWKPDPQNALSYIGEDGESCARYERWLGTDSPASRRPQRLPILNRWVIRKSALPSDLDCLSSWRRQVDIVANLLQHPE